VRQWCGGSRLAQVAQVTELQNELQERERYEKAQHEQLQLLDFKYNLLLDMVRVACPPTEPHRLHQGPGPDKRTLLCSVCCQQGDTTFRCGGAV
jgi:hypothetical protein